MSSSPVLKKAKRHSILIYFRKLKTGITPEEKATIIESMTQVLDSMFRKDSENKEFLGGAIRWISSLGVALFVCLGGALGIKAYANWNDRDK